MPAPVVDIVTIGTELLRGEITDTNAAWLGEQLYRNGFRVGVITTVGDDPGDMERTMRAAAARAEAVIVSGGLGPTVDDRTAEVAARVCGVSLKRDATALEQIHVRLASVGLSMTPNNEKQADIPAGAHILYNDAGTAPGFVTPPGENRAPMYFLPGVPRELERLFTRQVLPLLAADHPIRDAVAERRLRMFGTGESKIDFMLQKQIEAFGAGPDTEVAFRASWPEIVVTLRASAASEEEAQPAVDAAAARAREVVGRYLYAEGENTTLAATVGAALREQDLTLAVAESCTAGGLAAMLTDAAGASDFLLGGVVAYADAVKTSVLDVPASMIEEHGAVSEAVSRAMARGVRSLLGADIGIGITGIAGPGGGTEEKPVGLVHVAMAVGKESAGTGAAETALFHRSRVFRGNRQMIRRISCFVALALVLAHLRDDYGPDLETRT